MLVSKQQIVAFLRQRGDSERAEQAEKDLPETVDLDRDEAVVSALGVDPLDLAGDVPDHGGAAAGGQTGPAVDDDR